MVEVASIESDKAECRCLQAPMLVLARREELPYNLESSRIPRVLMADPLDSGDDVSTVIKPQASRYIHANVTPLLDL